MMRILSRPDRAESRSRFAQGGFTLIELLIVIGLIAVVYAVALPSLARLTTDGRLDRATNRLHAELRAARAQALLEGRAVALDVAAGMVEPDISVTVKKVPAGEAGARAETVKDHRVTFFPDGSATGRQITMSADGSQRALTLDWLTGKVSLAVQ